MTYKEAVDLIFAILDALIHRKQRGASAGDLPLNLLQEAFSRVESIGADTQPVRAQFAKIGLDLSVSCLHLEDERIKNSGFIRRISEQHTLPSDGTGRTPKTGKLYPSGRPAGALRQNACGGGL